MGKPCVAPERLVIICNAGRAQAASQDRQRTVQPRLCSNTSGRVGLAQRSGGVLQLCDSLMLLVQGRPWHRAQLQAEPLEGGSRGLQITPLSSLFRQSAWTAAGHWRMLSASHALCLPAQLSYRPEWLFFTVPDSSAGTGTSAPLPALEGEPWLTRIPQDRSSQKRPSAEASPVKLWGRTVPRWTFPRGCLLLRLAHRLSRPCWLGRSKRSSVGLTGTA